MGDEGEGNAAQAGGVAGVPLDDTPEVPPSAYYEDVLLQATAAAYAAEFDKQSPPKPMHVRVGSRPSRPTIVPPPPRWPLAGARFPMSDETRRSG